MLRKVRSTGAHAYVVSRTARVAAPPARVYSIIADYRNGHPRILPPQFTSLTVEKGGTGAGTEIRFTMKLLGRTYELRAVVSEPEPGRVLVERNSGANEAVSTFIVEPGSKPDESIVTISTEMPGRPGVAGALERWISRRLLLGIYADELRRLDALSHGLG